MATDEARWLRLCRNGDRAAFEALAGPHYTVARSFAARLLGNLDDAEDAVQDALLKAWSHLDSYRGAGAGFRAWLLRIVFHQCADVRRRAATRRRHEARVPPVAPARPLDPLEQREALARVRGAIASLPPRQRAALHLRVMEELSYRDIADVLDVTPGTARVYLVRARALLREQLEERSP